MMKYQLDSLAHAEVKGQSSVAHRLKGSELFIFYEGKMHVDDSSFEVETGDCFVVPPNALQYIDNTGNESFFYVS